MQRNKQLVYTSLFSYICLIGFLLAATANKIHNYDFWWHLRAGKDLINGCFEFFDTYTHTVLGTHWFNFHLNFQRLIFLIFKYFDWAGLVFIKVSIFLMLFLTATFKFRYNLYTQILLFILILNLAPRTMLRPEILTYIVLFISIKILKKPFNRKYLLLLPLQLFHANSHSTFLMTPLLLAIRFILDFFEKASTISHKRLKIKLTFFICILIISALTPLGIKGLLFPFELLPKVLLEQDIFKLYIGEFRSPFTDILSHPELFFLYLLTIVLIVNKFKKKLLFESACLFIFFILSIKAQRNINLLTIALLAIGPNHFNVLSKKIATDKIKQLILLSLSLLSIQQIYLYVTNTHYIYKNEIKRFGWSFNDVAYPNSFRKVLSPLNLNQLKIFNTMSLGGQISYQTPEIKTYIDGRLDVMGKTHFKKYIQMTSNIKFLHHELKKEKINCVILHYGIGEGLNTSKLFNYNDWKLFYIDSHLLIWLQTDFVETNKIKIIEQEDLALHIEQLKSNYSGNNPDNQIKVKGLEQIESLLLSDN